MESLESLSLENSGAVSVSLLLHEKRRKRSHVHLNCTVASRSALLVAIACCTFFATFFWQPSHRSLASAASLSSHSLSHRKLLEKSNIDPSQTPTTVSVPSESEDFLGGHFNDDIGRGIAFGVIMFRGALALIIFLALWAADVSMFLQYRINFMAALDLSPGTCPSPSDIYQISLCLFIWWTACASFFVVSIRGYHSHPEAPVLIFYVTVIALFFSKYNMCFYPSRSWLLTRIKRCFLAYKLSEISFAEVFIADALTSISKVLADLTRTAFILYQHMFLGEKSFSRTAYHHHFVPHIVASIPYLIRAVQCSVSYRGTADKTEKMLHLFNIAKYLSAFPVIITNAIPSIYIPDWLDDQWSTIFLLSACFNSLYSFLWDLVMDWGLLQPETKTRYLRSQLLLPSAWMYYSACLIDLILSTSPTSITTQRNSVLSYDVWSSWWLFIGDGKRKFALEALEVFRRAMWNVIRVEWECVKKGHAELCIVTHKHDDDED